MRRFDHFAVIDWSGESVPRPKGLALAHARQGDAAPVLLRPDKGWSRQTILDWLVSHAEARTDMLVGLDLSPAFPFEDRGAYFPGWAASPADAKALWHLVDRLSDGSAHLSASTFLEHPEAHEHFRHQSYCGTNFGIGRGRLRRCEMGQAGMGLSPSSCFNLVGAAQVGKSSLTGMRVLDRLEGRIPVWPFDPVPGSGPLIVEIYTSIAARAAGLRKGLSKIRGRDALDAALSSLGSRSHAPLIRYDDHSTDAILTTAWLRRVATDPALWAPPALTPHIAATEGWTFGVA